jgi:hypothetical protein
MIGGINMTLIINDIHIKKEKVKTFIVACADKRITYDDKNISTRKEKYGTRKKLFYIPYLNATVSYWGNTVAENNRGNVEYLSTWIPNFIRHNSDIKTLSDFVEKIRAKLNSRISLEQFKQYASGMHFCGFDKNNVPEFYHFSNCKWDIEKRKYIINKHVYGESSEDFQRRDFPDSFGFDGTNWSSVKDEGTQIYRNGDFHVHVTVWQKLDELYSEIFSTSNFSIKKNHDESIVKYYKSKLDFISSVYSNWAHEKRVGAPFDIIVLRPKN